MATVMIPASAISATLSADLSYNPNIHVQTVEIDRTGTNLATEYTNNYIKWYMSKVSFANMLRIVPGQPDVSNQIFTIDASQGRLFSDASAAIMKYSTSKTYTIPLHSPAVQYGTDAELAFANRYGHVGDISVNFERVTFDSDASDVTSPHTTLTTWSFANTSLDITINWNADASNVIAVTANAGADLEVNKAHNDAAADFIQIKMEGDAFDPHGRTSSSADIVSATVDYASKFASHTGGGVEIVAGVPTLTISDLTLTKALQQAINADSTSRDISNDDSLRSVAKQMIELRLLNGFQSAATIDGTLRTTIAGQYATSNDLSFSVNPIIFFRYREPTRFALAETDPYGAGQDGTVLYSSIYVAGIDSSGNVDNVDNLDDGTLTATLETYDGTSVTADSYEVITINHSLFENPNAVGYSDTSYNTFMYKINFPSQFYLYNYGTARSNDLSAVFVNGISLKVGREKSDLTELYPPTDVSYIYMIQQALSEAVEIVPIPAVTAEVAMATQTSTRGILSFAGGYDIRITDQYAGATVGVHKVCLYKTTDGVEALVPGAIGEMTIDNSLNKYSFVNNENDGTFNVWVNGEKQWNLSSTDVTNVIDLSGIDKLGTTYLNPVQNRMSGTLQDFKVFNTPLTETQIEEVDLPTPSVKWTMNSSRAEIGSVVLKNSASLATLSYKKSRPLRRKPPRFRESPAVGTNYTVGYSSITKSYTFKTSLKYNVIDASFTSTDGNHSGSTTFTRTGRTGTISFPTTTNTSGYIISNVQLRNIATGEVTDMLDATHGMTVPSSKLWLPPTNLIVTSTTNSNLTDSYLLVKSKACSLRCAFTGGTNFHTTTATQIIHTLEYSIDGGSTYLPINVNNVTAIDDSNKTIDFTFTAASVDQHVFRFKLLGQDNVQTGYYTMTVPSGNIYEYPTISTTTMSDTFAPVNKNITFTTTFSASLPSGVTAATIITPTGQSAVTASQTLLGGTQYAYSFTVLHDVVHTAAITLTMGNTSNEYGWANGTYDHNNIFVYPIIQSQTSLPSSKYTVGLATINKTYTFNTSLSDYTIDASFASIDGSHTGSPAFTASGTDATLSFPANSSSGYTVSNLKIRNVNDTDNEYLDIADATYGFTLSSSGLWLPPTTSTINASTQSSLPSPYLLVVNKQCSVRCAFTGGSNFHTSTAADLIHSLEYSTNGGTSYSSLSVGTAVTAVSDSNKTVDINFMATSTNEHLFRMKLKGDDTVTTSYYTFTVPTSSIFVYPTISSTAKVAPHDTADVTVGQTLAMESTFGETIHSSIVASIVVSDGTGNPTISSQLISGTKYSYSFVVANDADHSATITFTLGSTTNTYSWTAAGLLTAANDIYTFPNYVTYDGTSNGYDAGIHLKVDTSSNLVLTFTGGDQLHSDVYDSQVSVIQYKTGSSGSLVTVPSGDVTINSATGHENITLANIVPTAVDDIYFYVTLKGPDDAIMASSLTTIIPSTQVSPTNNYNFRIEIKYAGYLIRDFASGYCFLTLKFTNGNVGWSGDVNNTGNLTDWQILKSGGINVAEARDGENSGTNYMIIERIDNIVRAKINNRTFFEKSSTDPSLMWCHESHIYQYEYALGRQTRNHIKITTFEGEYAYVENPDGTKTNFVMGHENHPGGQFVSLSSLTITNPNVTV